MLLSDNKLLRLYLRMGRDVSAFFEFDPKMDRQELGLFLIKEAKKEQVVKGCPPERACAVATMPGTIKSLVVTADMDLKSVLVKYRELFG